MRAEMYNGLEIDVVDLGDADCSIVTQWNNGYPYRVLIDGGCGKDAETVIAFLRSRGYTTLWAAVCTHKHNDHASGLIKVVQSPYIAISNGWMHDMRKHFAPDALRRLCASDESVRTAVETTKTLAEAFTKRGIEIHEPFAGARIAGYPSMTVLGPSRTFYEKALSEFADVDRNPWSVAIAAALSGTTSRVPGLPPPPAYGALATLSGYAANGLPPLHGLLAKSSVQKNPQTQPFNSTSVILGVRHENCKMLLTADAGTEALACVGPEWNHLTYLGAC